MCTVTTERAKKNRLNPTETKQSAYHFQVCPGFSQMIRKTSLAWYI